MMSGIHQKSKFMTNNNKTKRGRPMGSNSFVSIKARDLVDLGFIGSETNIPVSKVWLREQGWVEPPKFEDKPFNPFGHIKY